jgi:hypothetical protein
MSFDEVYEALEKFVHYLAHTKANGAALMDHDEISGELFEELVKGYARYGHLPEGELLAVIRRMMDNRIAELTYKYYLTHRGLAVNALSLSFGSDGRRSDSWMQNVVWTSDNNACNVTELLGSSERVIDTLGSLSYNARKVFLAVLYGCPGLEKQIKLAGLRASFVYKGNGTVKVKPWHVAEALVMDEEVVKKAFKEIKSVYAEVVNGDV